MFYFVLHCCRKCDSDQIVKNGYNGVGYPKVQVQAGNFAGGFKPSVCSKNSNIVIRAAQKRPLLRK